MTLAQPKKRNGNVQLKRQLIVMKIEAIMVLGFESCKFCCLRKVYLYKYFGRKRGKSKVQVFFQQAAIVDRIVVDKEIDDKQVKITGDVILTADINEKNPSTSSCSESISELKHSDDFTSPCSSEDTSRILRACDSSPGTENPKYSQRTSKSSETRLSTRKNSSGKSSILSPPFSAGSPILSYKRFLFQRLKIKVWVKSSSSDFSSRNGLRKRNQRDQNSMHSKVLKQDCDVWAKPKARRGCQSQKKASHPDLQVSSYLPSNLLNRNLMSWISVP